jgi:hypothetical protein
MSKIEIVNELHKPLKKKFPRKSVKILGLNDLWQIDLFELIPYHKFNNGYKYVLVVINCFSKYVWTRNLKTKNANAVVTQMRDILKSNYPNICKNLQSDLGKEFYNIHFRTLMKEYGINHYSTFTHLKAQIVERVIRSLKEKLWKLFSFNGSYKWIDIIDDVVHEYNNTFHRTIKLKPSKVTKENEKFILQTIYLSKTKSLFEKIPKFKIGDFVRISKYKKMFEKGYTPNYTTEIFKIINVNKKYPHTYLLEDYEKNPIAGQFYTQELLKVKYPNMYLVEKVLKQKGKKSFVKYLGFSTKHNEWINSSDIVK